VEGADKRGDLLLNADGPQSGSITTPVLRTGSCHEYKDDGQGADDDQKCAGRVRSDSFQLSHMIDWNGQCHPIRVLSSFIDLAL